MIKFKKRFNQKQQRKAREKPKRGLHLNAGLILTTIMCSLLVFVAGLYVSYDSVKAAASNISFEEVGSASISGTEYFGNWYNGGSASLNGSWRNGYEYSDATLNSLNSHWLAGITYTLKLDGMTGGIRGTVHRHNIGWTNTSGYTTSYNASYPGGGSWIEAVGLELQKTSNSKTAVGNFYYIEYYGRVGYITEDLLKAVSGGSTEPNLAYYESVYSRETLTASRYGTGAITDASAFNMTTDFQSWVGTYGMSLPLSGIHIALARYPQKVTINTNGGTINGTAYNTTLSNYVGYNIVFSDIPYKEGYFFTGWDSSYTYYTSSNASSYYGQYPYNVVLATQTDGYTFNISPATP